MPSQTAIRCAPASSSASVGAARAARPRRRHRGGRHSRPPPRARPSRRRRPARRRPRGCPRACASRDGVTSTERTRMSVSSVRRTSSGPSQIAYPPDDRGALDVAPGDAWIDRGVVGEPGVARRPRRGSRLASGTMIADRRAARVRRQPPLASGSSVAADHLPRVRSARARRRHAGRRARLHAGRGHRPLRWRVRRHAGVCSTSSATIA